MANYGIKYQTQFDGVSDEISGSRGTYTLQFLFKNYTGPSISLTGGSTTFIQKTLTDEPFGIRGKSADIKLLNYGNIPVTSFYSDDDDGVKVILYDSGMNVLFVGYLIQDDLNELMVDYVHEISMTASDSLGLLKGVILSEANARQAFLNQRIRTNGPLNEILMSITDPAFNPVVGNSVAFLGGEYEITAVSTVPITIGGNVYTYTLTITPDVPATLPATDTDVYLIGPVDLIGKNSILTVINCCLSSTNLSLLVNIYSTLNELNQDFSRASFEQTLVDTEVFINGDIFDNCYNVLDTILKTFRCTLTQAYGQWNIVHYDQLREFPGGDLPGYQYDENFVFLGPTTLNCTFTIGPTPQSTRPAAGLMRGSQRGLKFSRKQFDYKQPKYLLRNYDLHLLGTFKRSYISSGLEYKEYEFPEKTWTKFYLDRSFIVVVTDVALQTEVTRYVYQPKFNNGLPMGYQRFNNVQFNDIEVNQGDRFTFNISTKTASSTGSSVVYYRFGFFLQTTTGQYYNLIDGFGPGSNELHWNQINVTPIQSTGIVQVIDPAIVNPQDYQTFSLQELDYRGIVPSFPVDGLLRIRIYGTSDTNVSQPNVDAIWKDITFNLIYYINESVKIIGHVHKDTRTTNVKNNSDVTLIIDDSPKNSIAGTLFLTQSVGLLQKRARQWRKDNTGSVYRLGEITTHEDLQYRKMTRTKVDGTFIGIWQNVFISELCPVITTFDPTKVYVWGPLTIDYKHNQCSGTLYEIYDSAEPELTADYTFTYIYDNK